jgi:iron only hydrogenase large subunit-like protein
MTGSGAFHSVTLDPDKCKGCTTCLKHCPTEAIRVRKGKAHILDERCVDCGECIRVCPSGAKKAVSDPLDLLKGFSYRVAIPAPTLYGQFDERYSVDRILSGLLALGFDEVFEVAQAAELVADASAAWIRKAGPGPWISSACPAVVKLIQIRFPSLLDRLVPLISPMEAAARIVKRVMYPGRENVGVFFLSPCAGKVTVARYPQGFEKSCVDGVLGIKDIYLPLRNLLNGVEEKPLARAGSRGIAWARVDGESDAVGERLRISVDGISDVIGVLEAVENGKIRDVAFIEASACPAGCVGGPLTVENPYIAKTRLRNREESAQAYIDRPRPDLGGFQDYAWDSPLKARSALRLDPDVARAMVMMEEIEIMAESLPGLDCGSCGAPTCKALAEDIVRNTAVSTDCVFKLRERVRDLAEELFSLERMQPPGLDREDGKDDFRL